MADAEDTLRKLLAELARADAPAVIEQAREGARERAGAVLENMLVDELLKAAAVPVRGSTAAVTDAGTAWWVYCVVPADQASSLTEGLSGVEPGTAVESVAEGGLAALVSSVSLAEYGDEQLRRNLEDTAWLERTARSHESVQAAVMRHSPIVPLRLCTLYRDADGVRRGLRENAGVFAQGLASVAGCAEWGVKVFLERGAVRPEMTIESAPRGGSGTDYLAARQRERDQATQADELSARCADQVHRTVAALARQDRVNAVQSPEAHGRQAEMVLNGAYLVEHDRLDELHETVSALHGHWASQGLNVELTGPWPPYNFVSDSAGMLS